MPAIAAGFAAITGPVGLVIAAIAALAAGILYMWDNWKAIQERISDISWWRNALIEMLQFLTEWNAINLLLEQVNNLISYFGGNPIPNPFESMEESLEGLKVETKEYEHEFGSFADAIKNGAKAATDALLPMQKQAEKTGEAVNALSGSGGGGRGRAPIIDAPDAPGLKPLGPNGLPNMQIKETADVNAVEENPDPYAPWRKSLQKFAPIVSTVQQGFQGFFNTLLSGGQNPFQAFIDGLKRMVTRLLAAAAAAAALAALLQLTGIGGAGATFGGGFKQLFGQMSGFGNIMGSAAGGGISGKEPRLVGEMGPEIFMPQGAGTIIPNNQLRGGGGVQRLHVTAGNLRVQGDALQTGINVSGAKNKRWR